MYLIFYLGISFETILQIKLESNPPDNKHAIGLSDSNLFCTELIKHFLIKS